MCPEFARDRMDKDRYTADRKRRIYRTSPVGTDVRCGSDKNRNITQTDRWNSRSSRTAHLEDRAPRCSLQHRSYYNDNTHRKLPTERSRSSPVDYRHKVRRLGSQRSRSRSPGHQISYFRSESHRYQEERNDSRRNADTFNLVSQEMSPYRDSSNHNRLSTYARRIRPVEQDRFFDVGTGYTTNESESRKHKEILHSIDEKVQCKCTYTDATNSSNKKTRRTMTSSRQCDERTVNDSFPLQRGYSTSNRPSRAELCEDIQHSHRQSSECCNFCNARDHRSSSFSGCSCRDTDDPKHPRTNVCDRLDDRTDRRNAASPVNSRNESNSKSHRNINDAVGKTRTNDRRRSLPHSRRSVVEDKTAVIGKKHNDSSVRQLADSDNRLKSSNKDNDEDHGVHEDPCARKLKSTRKHLESSPSCVSVEKCDSVSADHTSDGPVSSQYSSNEKSSSQSDVAHFSKKDQSVAILDSDTDKKHCPPVTAQTSSHCPVTDSVLSASEHCVVMSWPSSQEGSFLGSLPQPVIQSGQIWVGSSDPTVGVRLLRPHWPGSTVMAQHVTSDKKTLHDLRPVAAVTQLPRLPTKMSTIPTGVDAHVVGMPRVSLNSNMILSNLPSITSFNPSAWQPVGEGTVGQYMMDNVYGDSPLLDEPSYYSPVAVHDSSLNLVGSSVSSVDCIHHPVDDPHLKKMLDVVTVAKTTLERTLPPGCNTDPSSVKQQKVFDTNLTIYLLIIVLSACTYSYFSVLVLLTVLQSEISLQN